MIESFAFQNYKAFASGEIEPKPITILVGANSSGKSSILQLLLLFSQTQGRDLGTGPLTVNGDRASFGDALNIIKDRSVSKPLSFKFRITPTNIFDNELIADLARKTVFESLSFTREPSNKHLFANASQSFDTLNSPKQVSIDIKKELMNPLISLAEWMRDEFRKNKKSLTPQSDVAFKKENASTAANSSLVLSPYEKLVDTLTLIRTTAEEPIVDHVEYAFFYSAKSATLELQSISLSGNDKDILTFSRRRPNGRMVNDLRSDIFANSILRKYRTNFSQQIHTSGLEVLEGGSAGFRLRVDNEVFEKFLFGIFNRATQKINESFIGERIQHVSPLRASPRRYYLLDRHYARASLDTQDGALLADILKKKKPVREHVNKWLRNFGLSVNVHDVRDIIQSIKVEQNGLDLDLTDVGFGISQVLPVIVQGFLAEANSMTLIEQPEIHLHPKMQADLADLFVDMVKTTRSKILVETHSEYILKRLRRRIAEGVISAEDVGIYLVHGTLGKNRSSYIEQAKIGKMGAFKWPKDFSETELEDTIAFARLQISPQPTDAEPRG